MNLRPFQSLLRQLVSPWTWRMAWRDSRTSRRKLLLFSGSIVLGIAALTAIGSLAHDLERAIEEQAKALLGADLVLTSTQALSPEAEAFVQTLGGEQSREIAFSTMVYFERTEGTRLVQIRALEGGFPFYGQLEADPAGAATKFRNTGGVLMEEGVFNQFNAQVGDRVRLGKLSTPIVGHFKKAPGETFVFATIAPRVYVLMKELEATGLIQRGSLVRYKVHFKFDPSVNVPKLVERIKPKLSQLRLRNDTVEDRKRDLGRSMENLYHFLNLVGFIALLLGGVGVASAIHVHVIQKLPTVAVLRCLGASMTQTFSVYLAQGAALGLAGAAAGALLGVAIQTILPRVLADLIPFKFEVHFWWGAVAFSMSIGFVICLLFALLPLLRVRQVSPLAAIRVAFEPGRPPRDPWRWVISALLVTGIGAFAGTQTRDWRIGLSFAAGLVVVFGLLAGTARLLMGATQKLAAFGLPYPVRQGLANLHRPNNRTLLLLLALGLGTFLMLMLALVQQTLLTQLVSSSGTNQPNAILFDIQATQRAGVIDLVHSLGLPVLDEAPIVTMRLSSIKGRSVESLLADKQSRIPGWALRREYRCSYNDRLRDGEKLIAGKWVPQVGSSTPTIPISVEDGIARELHLKLGDELIFDVQGVPVTTRVASLREVDWRRIQPNFFVMFPRGALEDAPTMRVVVTRVTSDAASARLQRDVVKAFPNVSVIDLTLILQTLDTVLTKIGFVVRFMAMFTVATGLFVMAGALMTGRYQRIRESVLLRTLGASRKQISRILAVEYVALGLLAASTAAVLAVLASWLLAKFLFEVKFDLDPGPLILAMLGVPALTLVLGLALNRGVTRSPPLAILRAENP